MEDLATAAAEVEEASGTTILVAVAEMHLFPLVSMVIRIETMALISSATGPGVEAVRRGKTPLFDRTPTRVTSPGIASLLLRLLGTTFDLTTPRLDSSDQQVAAAARTGRTDLEATADRGRTATRHGNKTRAETITEERARVIDQTATGTAGIEAEIETAGTAETAEIAEIAETAETEKRRLCIGTEECLQHYHHLFHQHRLVPLPQLLLRLDRRASVNVSPTKEHLHHNQTAGPLRRPNGNAKRLEPAPRHSQTQTSTTPTTPTTLATQKRRLANGSAKSMSPKWTPVDPLGSRWAMFHRMALV